MCPLIPAEAMAACTRQNRVINGLLEEALQKISFVPLEVSHAVLWDAQRFMDSRQKWGRRAFHGKVRKHLLARDKLVVEYDEWVPTGNEGDVRRKWTVRAGT